MAQCVARQAPMQQCVWWLVLARTCHSVKMTYRPSAALRLLGSLEYPTTNSCGPINKSLSLSDALCPGEFHKTNVRGNGKHRDRRTSSKEIVAKLIWKG